MEEVNLFLVMASAFVAVIVLLSVLSVLIRLLAVVFAEPQPAQRDVAVEAAIEKAVEASFPGARVTKIEEVG